MARKKVPEKDQAPRGKPSKANAGAKGKMGRAGELGAIGNHTRTDRDEDYPEQDS